MFLQLGVFTEKDIETHEYARVPVFAFKHFSNSKYMHHSIECDVKIRQNNTATVLVLESNRVSKTVLNCASETKRKNEKLRKKR